MEKINGILMSFKEFDDCIRKITGGKVDVVANSDEWYYCITEEYDGDNIEVDLGNYLHVEVDQVIIDLTKDEEENSVVIIVK